MSSIRRLIADAKVVRSISNAAVIGFINTENAKDEADCALTAHTPTRSNSQARHGSPQRRIPRSEVVACEFLVEIVPGIHIERLPGYSTR
jgi:hypothetical protein